MQDLRLAIRSLRATPIVTAVAILSLALGIGANTAIFSLIDSLLLRPLPVMEPQRLVVVSDTRATRQGVAASWTYATWDQIRLHATPFDGTCAWWIERLNLSPQGGETEPVDAMWVSGEYFTTLGVPALLGRTVASQDDRTGAGPDGAVGLISYELWQRRFGGAAGVIGMPIIVERVPFTIVGVTPPGFFGAEVGRTFDLVLPIHAEPLIRGTESRINPQRGFYALTVLLRLKAGQSVEAATALLRAVQPQIRDGAMPTTLPPVFQKEFLKDAFVAMPAATGTSRLRLRYERPLVVILIVVALVLLVACANIANLQLARAIARRHEMSVRIALGATQWRVARQSLLESLLLSGAGAGIGLLFAGWCSHLLVGQLSTALNRIYLDLTFDWRVLAFTAAVGIATTVLFGLLPAVRAVGVAPIDALKEPGHGSPIDARARVSNGLVIGQVAVSVVIVVAAGLFVRTFEKLATLPPGFDAGRVLAVNVNLARTHVDVTDRTGLLDRLVRTVAAVPGAAKVAGSMISPVQGLGIVDLVEVPGVPLSSQAMVNGKLGDRSTYANFITPGWFATYGTPLRAGRDFDDRDVKGAPSVVIVNEAFVRKFLAGRNPIGATVAMAEGGPAPATKTVVGVVNNAAYTSLRNGDVPIAYRPLAQVDFPAGMVPTDFVLSVRAAERSPMLLVRSIAAALTAVNPDLVFAFQPLTDQVNASLTQERLIALLSGFFGALALLLAGLGLYGMTAYAVARRRAEIGIRMALGAAPAGVINLVLSRVALLVGLGIVIGGVVSLWASKFVASLLYGVEPRDPVTLLSAAAILATVGAVAGWLPAWRASRIDPAAVLRQS